MQTYAIKNFDLFLDLQTTGDRPYRLRDLPPAEKPREKLLALGVSALTLAELLELVIGQGTAKEDVREMSERIVREFGEKTLMADVGPQKLSDDMAIPIIKAMQIVAVAEIGRRFYKKRGHGLATVRTAKDVYEHLKDMRELSKENLRGLYLNQHHKVIKDEVISIGTIDANIVHPREVFRPALEYSAVAVILAHNHPSGSLKPSDADIEITKQLVESGKIMGIQLLDHIIITKNGYASIPVSYD